MTDFFAFYGLTPSLELNPALLKKLFFEKSRTFHPDFFANESEEAQADALKQSTLNNEAYKTLLDPQSRLKHFLQLNGELLQEDKTSLPPDFLMEMMDLNEEIEMAEDETSGIGRRVSLKH
ncbi:MAG: hypothetical protein HYZ42_01135 [Bacteroidetes bacterium]|nr:hypothetical protein [Bacteroidota bacterium]